MQYHITTQNLDYPKENDCLLPEDDPIHAIKKSLMIGGIGIGPAILAADPKPAPVKWVAKSRKKKK
jgi:hypothetical protein